MFDPEASAALPSLRLDHVSGLVERDLAKQEEIGDLEVVRSVQGFDTAARRFGLENFLVVPFCKLAWPVSATSLIRGESGSAPP